MRSTYATEIAKLLNAHNQLKEPCTEAQVLKQYDTYLVDTADDRVLGCVQTFRVQWYQWELRHLVVDPAVRRTGIATRLVHWAIEVARSNALLVQATVRLDNTPSQELLAKVGFARAATLKTIAVWQYIL